MSEIARIPSTEENLKRPHFTLRKTSPNDFESGKIYWIGGYFSDTSNNLEAFEKKSGAIAFAVKQIPVSLYFENMGQLKLRFPNVWEKFIPFDLDNRIKAKNILQREGCFLYINRLNNEKITFILKRIKLE